MKKTKKLSVSIGIPAYNEEANIWHLLDSLLRQKLGQNIKLQEIIVISDGSTDKTVELVRSIKDRRIKIFEHNKRSGLYKTQNEIVNYAQGEILTLVNADIIPQDDYFLKEIITPILDDHKVGLVGSETIPANPISFFERIIADSHEFKKYMYRGINKGDNIYLCHGRARAFSKKFYTQIKWPKNCPEDAYSYLLALKKGFKFVFTPKAKVIYRSPTIFSEYAEKSNRFLVGKKRLTKYFPQKYLKSQYQITLLLTFKTLVRFLLTKPVTTISYILILLYIRLFSRHDNITCSMWRNSFSSKKIIYAN